MKNEKMVFSSRTYVYRGHPYAMATFTDFGPGEGLLQIYSDWGVFASKWNSTGKDTIEEFVLGCNDGYLTNNLEWWMRYGAVKKEGFTKLHKFMIECWPNLKAVISDEYFKSKQEVKVSEMAFELKSTQTALDNVMKRRDEYWSERCSYKARFDRAADCILVTSNFVLKGESEKAVTPFKEYLSQFVAEGMI